MLQYKQCIPFHKKSHQTLKPKNVRSHRFLPYSALFIFPPFYVHRLMRTVFPGSSDTSWAFGRSIYRNELVKLPSSRNSSGDWETGVQPCWCFPHLLFFHQKKLDGGLEFFHQKDEHCQRWHNLVSIQATGTLSRHRSFDCPTNAIARTLAVCCGKKSVIRMRTSKSAEWCAMLMKLNLFLYWPAQPVVIFAQLWYQFLYFRDEAS